MKIKENLSIENLKEMEAFQKKTEQKYLFGIANNEDSTPKEFENVAQFANFDTPESRDLLEALLNNKNTPSALITQIFNQIVSQTNIPEGLLSKVAEHKNASAKVLEKLASSEYGEKLSEIIVNNPNSGAKMLESLFCTFPRDAYDIKSKIIAHPNANKENLTEKPKVIFDSLTDEQKAVIYSGKELLVKNIIYKGNQDGLVRLSVKDGKLQGVYQQNKYSVKRNRGVFGSVFAKVLQDVKKFFNSKPEPLDIKRREPNVFIQEKADSSANITQSTEKMQTAKNPSEEEQLALVWDGQNEKLQKQEQIGKGHSDQELPKTKNKEPMTIEGIKLSKKQEENLFSGKSVKLGDIQREGHAYTLFAKIENQFLMTTYRENKRDVLMTISPSSVKKDKWIKI